MIVVRNLARQLRDRLKETSAIAILGPRQVGKTTLSKQLADDYIYLDLENPRDLAKLHDAYTFLESLQDRTVIISEVHYFLNILYPKAFN